MASTAVAPSEVGVEVGDFFVASWGYDQTNIDFYKVVGLTPKGVKVQQWSSALADDQRGAPYQDAVIPGESPKQGCWVKTEGGWSEYDRNAPAPIQTKRLNPGYGSRPCFTVASYASAYKWDGKPDYQTGAGYGH